MAGIDKLGSFTTITYVTNDGEKVTATKKDGIVTINGEKRGVVQMPVEEFIQNEILKNLPKMEAPIAEDTAVIGGEAKTIPQPAEQASVPKDEGQKVNVEV